MGKQIQPLFDYMARVPSVSFWSVCFDVQVGLAGCHIRIMIVHSSPCHVTDGRPQ